MTVHVRCSYIISCNVPLSCSLAELPECRLEIASNSDVLRQLIAVITTKTYKYIASLVSVAGMLCLAYRYATSVTTRSMMDHCDTCDTCTPIMLRMF